MYLVSVLIPVYRVENYIDRCARSLFEQTYPNLEYVFVDDCSPDNSIGVLERIMDEYPVRKVAARIIKHEHNRGLAASRNTALDNACGEFVCAVDSDDWLELDAIEKLVYKQLETSADIVAGNMMMHSNDGDQPFYETKCRNKEERVLLQLQKSWDHTVCRKLIRRSLYEDNGIRCIEGCDMTEDRYQMAQLTYYANSYAQIEDIIYHYDRRNEGSIMAQKEIEKKLGKDFQYLKNWQGIKNFFADKETVFFQEANEKTIQFGKRYLIRTIEHNSREWYNRMASFLDQEKKEFQDAFGWTKRGIRGFYKHCFPLVEGTYRLRLLIDSVKRRK